MKKYGLGALALLLTAGCGAVDIPVSNTNQSETTGFQASVFADDADPALKSLPFDQTQILVQPYPGVDPVALATMFDRIGVVETENLSHIDLITLSVPSGDIHDVAEELARSELIEEIHKNYLFETQQTIPNDPLFDLQPHLAQIAAPQAWDLTMGNEAIPIALVDTGTDREHPDLADQIIDGWNIPDQSGNFGDVVGHGTETAGVAAAASNNQTGVTGVAWDSPVLVVRVTNDRGRSTSRNLAAGILWAADHGAKVINVSFAPLWSNSVVRAAAQQAFHRGALVVISAGNGGESHPSIGYPEALFVGAVTGANRVAVFSDQGPFVDLVAPGTAIRTTTRGATYGLANGTSFSAPIVSGVAALAWSVNPSLRPVSIMNAMTSTAVDLGTPGKDDTFGVGLVDAASAVRKALQTTETPDNTRPIVRITRPTGRKTLTSRTGISVIATDNDGVADVVLSIDDIPVATDTRSPYRFVIDTAAFSAGAHTLRTVATDFSGNVSQADSVGVRFGSSSNNPSKPPVRITFQSPAASTPVSGNVTIAATVVAKAGLATVEWFVDGEAVVVNTLAGPSSGVSFLWRTARETRGEHTVTLTVTDARGRQGSADLRLIVR